MHYTQCKIQKGNLFHVAWIPSTFAIIGKFIKIKFDDIWQNGWKVVERWSSHESKEVEAREMDYKLQRKASDI